MRPPILEVSDICKSFDNIKYVLQGVNLRVAQGETLLIRGRSGAGKTTLLDLIGLIDKPTSGRISFNGYDTSKLSEKELAWLRLRKIGILFQSHNLLDELTVFENVILPLRLARNRNGHARAERLLETFDLSALAQVKPPKLSGGERQRVAIARALANNPTIVLADEPTCSLDVDNSENVLHAFRKANREFNTTIIIASHDPIINGHAQRHYQLMCGRLIEVEE